MGSGKKILSESTSGKKSIKDQEAIWVGAYDKVVVINSSPRLRHTRLLNVSSDDSTPAVRSKPKLRACDQII